MILEVGTNKHICPAMYRDCFKCCNVDTKMHEFQDAVGMPAAYGSFFSRDGRRGNMENHVVLASKWESPLASPSAECYNLFLGFGQQH